MRRRRLSPPTVISLMALFFSVGGVSFAALSITGKDVQDGSLSGRDIRDASITSRDVRNGALLAKDFKRGQLRRGETGPPGPQGPEGPAGTPGAQGPVGDRGAPAFDANVTLETNESESGVYGVGSAAVSGLMIEGIEFRLPLRIGLDSAHIQFHASDTAFTTQCPAEGHAAAGYLCVYEQHSLNRFEPTIATSRGMSGSDPYGFMVLMTSTGMSGYSYGNWTLTAP